MRSGSMQTQRVIARKDCPRGFFMVVPGQDICERCQNGSISTEGSSSCSICGPGRFQREKDCQICPRGFFQNHPRVHRVFLVFRKDRTVGLEHRLSSRVRSDSMAITQVSVLRPAQDHVPQAMRAQSRLSSLFPVLSNLRP